MNNDNDQTEIKGHSYDGISEYDNPLPTWWLWTFFLAIIFAFLYFIHYTFGGGPTLTQELAVAMEELNKNKLQMKLPVETEEVLAGAMKQENMLSIGANTYSSKCSVCHGNNLQGQIGPNLTDSYWIHGKGNRADIIKVIRDGIPDKGMPPWGQVLNQEETYAVTAFIFSKVGTNPANPKAPQGEMAK